MEVFGQSECTGPMAVSTKEAWKMGSCGRPMLVSHVVAVAIAVAVVEVIVVVYCS